MTDTTTDTRRAIADRRTALGIELGSTRIKAVLVGPDHQPIAIGGYSWESQYVEGLWTYSLDAVWDGLRRCFTALAEHVRDQYDIELTGVGSLGVSAMMHGYLAFDEAGEQLTPFRTWRNTTTGEAAERLSASFDHNIAHRWSVAHLYQALLDGETHTGHIAYLTTLAGLRPLATQRREGPWCRRRQWNVSDRHHHRQVRPCDASLARSRNVTRHAV